VRGEVAAAVPQTASRACQDQLGADAVGRGGEQALAVEGMEAREGAEPRRPSRLDRGT
jgi:hypothetical protein